MHCLMSLSSQRWLCALSGSVRGRASEFCDAHKALGLWFGRCPLYPRKRTFGGDSRMSALCQKATYALQQNACHSITSSAVALPTNGPGHSRDFIASAFEITSGDTRLKRGCPRHCV
jgi:hypothetical protein